MVVLLRCAKQHSVVCYLEPYSCLGPNARSAQSAEACLGGCERLDSFYGSVICCRGENSIFEIESRRIPRKRFLNFDNLRDVSRRANLATGWFYLE